MKSSSTQLKDLSLTMRLKLKNLLQLTGLKYKTPRPLRTLFGSKLKIKLKFRVLLINFQDFIQRRF